MGRYDGVKYSLQHRLGIWTNKQTNNLSESEAKSIPCHVVKTDKDFLYIQFDTQNGIFTMPTVKMTQGYSRFGREPTQVGDKGYAVPNNYYMGGMSAYSGGQTDFYPRGNLSSLSFQPVANYQAPKRDYDQHHETGGPNGWLVRTMEPQQEGGAGSQSPSSGGSNGSGGGGTGTGTASVSNTAFRAQQRTMQQRNFVQTSRLMPTPRNGGISNIPGIGSGGVPSIGGLTSSLGTGGQQQQQQQQSQTQFSFDKNDLATIQSKDTNHLVTVDSQNKKITLQVPTNENVYVGGDGKQGSYAQLVTTKGPVINAQGRYA